MTRIGVRELRQNASRYLDVVKRGGTVEVTERGKLVALLVPATPATSERDRLVTAGRLIPARTAFRTPVRRGSIDGGRTASEILREQRGERRT